MLLIIVEENETFLGEEQTVEHAQYDLPHEFVSGVQKKESIGCKEKVVEDHFSQERRLNPFVLPINDVSEIGDQVRFTLEHHFEELHTVFRPIGDVYGIARDQNLVALIMHHLFVHEGLGSVFYPENRVHFDDVVRLLQESVFDHFDFLDEVGREEVDYLQVSSMVFDQKKHVVESQVND